MKRNFYHEDGVLFDESKPVAIGYDNAAEVRATIRPEEKYGGDVKIEPSDSSSLRYLLAPDNFEVNPTSSDEWSKQSPIQVTYEFSTDLESLEEPELVGGKPLQEFVDNQFEDPDSMDAVAVADWLSEEFEYRRNDAFNRREFLDERAGRCDQLAELMSVFNSNWIKQQGFARPGDENLPNQEKEFISHSWVFDTEKNIVYDPAPMMGNDKEPKWVERDTEVYFLQTPRVNAETKSGENIRFEAGYSTEIVQ